MTGVCGTPPCPPSSRWRLSGSCAVPCPLQSWRRSPLSQTRPARLCSGLQQGQGRRSRVGGRHARHANAVLGTGGLWANQISSRSRREQAESNTTYPYTRATTATHKQQAATHTSSQTHRKQHATRTTLGAPAHGIEGKSMAREISKSCLRSRSTDICRGREEDGEVRAPGGEGVEGRQRTLVTRCRCQKCPIS